MNTYTKILTPAIALTSAAFLPVFASASDLGTQTIAVQAEVNADEVSLMTDILYEAALANAAAKTLDANNEWFSVVYRDAKTETVTRNINSDAESRYIDMEDGERVEADIPTEDVIVQVQKIDFKMGTGPKPANTNSFAAKKLILPDS